MSIIEKRTVRFCTDVIPGFDSIEYVDACFQQYVYLPNDVFWAVHEVGAFNGLAPKFDTLTDEQQELVWQLAEQHQAKAHENDE